MYSDDFGDLRSGEVRRELRSSVAARRDLGHDLEDEVLEAFLARVERRIDARVAAELNQYGAAPRKPAKQKDRMFWVIVVSLVLAIPLTIIAVTGTPKGLGIIPVMGTVICINLVYALDRWLSRRR